VLGKINLIIKLHPRSNQDLYKNLVNDNPNVIIWKGEKFPQADCYIGHESTVVAKALYITSKTMIYRLMPDRVSPFEQFSDFVCENSESFKKVFTEMLSAQNVEENKSEALKEFAWKNNNGAIETAANVINVYLQGGTI